MAMRKLLLFTVLASVGVVVSATGLVFSYAAVIDKNTTDPIFVVGAEDEPPQPVTPVITLTPTTTPTPPAGARTVHPGPDDVDGLRRGRRGQSLARQGEPHAHDVGRCALAHTASLNDSSGCRPPDRSSRPLQSAEVRW